ncbi:hypothetical protein [Methanococcoides burtonii]|uniref:hypothetical protein n=1 Tax=Methanococcoides burtonii TaxID=29291 RepID=UPI000045E1CD|nr:hypothetical protein [Methanococcoides burtonii]
MHPPRSKQARSCSGVPYWYVVVSYFEWIQNLNQDYWEEEKIIEKLRHKMMTAFEKVYPIYCEEKGSMRRTALQLAIKRILEAERLRGTL